MATVNIGILAHVDAGKTSLTERILFETGIISSIGSVDKGTTQTDTLELERTRGITIKSAVVSFQLGDLKVNLIDTPGHSDFIAEVERSLRVLDGVVLVVSAVEGVQPQTRRLAQAIRAAGLPLFIFVNKIDRIGARGAPLIDDIRKKLAVRVVCMNDVTNIGSRQAEISSYELDHPDWREPVIDLLAEANELVIEEFDRTDGRLDDAFLRAELRAQISGNEIVPAFFGSAITGAGVSELLAGIETWMPAAEEDRTSPPAGIVFKITREPSGQKLVYVRLFTGEIGTRQYVKVYHQSTPGDCEDLEQDEERITGIDRFVEGSTIRGDTVVAGEISILHGIHTARIGDGIGHERPIPQPDPPAFPRPVLESIVQPNESDELVQLRTALEELAEQDPLITLRQSNDAGEISVCLFGEVQKEVMQETLSREYGIKVTFGASQTICFERPTGVGEYTVLIDSDENPCYATVGFRIQPGERGTGIGYERQLGSLPLAFYRAIEETVYKTLTQGLAGWNVTDCAVTLTQVGMNPLSTAADFRKLTPVVLIETLRLAGTEVCEPVERVDLRIPEDTFGAVCGVVINGRGTIQDAFLEGEDYRIICEIPTVELPAIEQQLPGLTRGEGDWVSKLAGYIPVTEDVPVRSRVGPNPLNRAHYWAEVSQT